MRGCGAALILAAMFLAVGCEERERANPFDPENPDTGGVPLLLDARASNGGVDLLWSTGGVTGLHLARMFRRTPSDGAVIALTPSGLDPFLLQYRDSAARNGIEYEYRLDFELPSGTLIRTEWDPARPGPEIPWVADGDGGGLARLTPDGRDLLQRVETGRWLLDLAADTVAMAIWSADYLAGKILRHAVEGGAGAVSWDLPGARTVDLGAGGSTILAGSFGNGRIEEREPDGDLLWSDMTGVYVEDIFVAGDGALWVAGRLEGDTGEILLYRDRALSLRRAGFGHPVAIVESDRAIVVLDRKKGALFRYGLDANPAGESDPVLVDPRDLCADGEGGVWVADPGRSSLVRFDRELRESASVPIPGVMGITRESRRGGLWAAGEQGIHVLDSEGQVISLLRVGPRPVKVGILYSGEAG